MRVRHVKIVTEERAAPIEGYSMTADSHVCRCIRSLNSDSAGTYRSISTSEDAGYVARVATTGRFPAFSGPRGGWSGRRSTLMCPETRRMPGTCSTTLSEDAGAPVSTVGRRPALHLPLSRARKRVPPPGAHLVHAWCTGGGSWAPRPALRGVRLHICAEAFWLVRGWFGPLDLGAPERTRTSDTRFRKPLLYPLSYEGGLPEATGTASGSPGRALFFPEGDAEA
jgi:hypothetical protein